ncbi:hypothetical protein [Microcoleus sp. Pol12A6]
MFLIVCTTSIIHRQILTVKYFLEGCFVVSIVDWWGFATGIARLRPLPAAGYAYRLFDNLGCKGDRMI